MHDRDYIARYAEGFDELEKRLPEYTPERVAQWTGVSREDIERLAREYATTRPAAIRLNYGIQRSQNGGAAVRAVCMLPVITGSWKEVGGGLQLSTSGGFQLDRAAMERHDLMLKSPLGRPARTVNMVRTRQGADRTRRSSDQSAGGVQLESRGGLSRSEPGHGAVCKRDDLFTVVHEQFLTDTTDYADLVLPATTFFEHKDLVQAYGHYYLQVSQPAIEPLGECKSNVEFFRELALRMGFEDECFREPVDAMIDAALQSGVPQLNGITPAAPGERPVRSLEPARRRQRPSLAAVRKRLRYAKPQGAPLRPGIDRARHGPGGFVCPAGGVAAPRQGRRNSRWSCWPVRPTIF